MRLIPVLAAALLVLGACSAKRGRLAPNPPVTDEAPAGGDISGATNRDALDALAGRLVTAEGVFGQVGGRHGTLTLSSGLLLYIPHFDLFRRGDDWFKYVGQRVRVSGVLYADYTEVQGIRGPAIAPRSFQSPR